VLIRVALHDSPSMHPDSHAECGLFIRMNLANIGGFP
jgi:hypothetical protein